MATLAELRKIRDVLIEAQSASGIEQVPCYEFQLTDGQNVQVISPSNPALDRPASDMVAGSLKLKTSAEAGGSRINNAFYLYFS